MFNKIRVIAVCSVALIMVIGLVFSVQAGWVMEESNGDRALFSDGRMKGYFENEGVILNGKTQVLVLINAAEKTYVQGTVDEICNELKTLQEKILAMMTPEMRKMIEQNDNSANSPMDVTVRKKGSGGTIAGFETDRYEVLVDGELYEEIWITSVSSLTKELRPLLKTMEKFDQCVDAMTGDTSPELSPEYLDIVSKGVVLKSVRYEMGMPENETDVVRMEEQTIPDEEFQIPEGYQKITYSELMGSME